MKVWINSEDAPADILLRAHMYDSKAIIAASLGYTMGMDGFPKDPWLGAAWAPNLAFLIHYPDLAVLNLLAFHEIDPEHREADKMIVNCPGAQASSLAKTLKEAKILDVAGICTQLEKQGAKHPVADPERRFTESTQKAEQQTRHAMALMREFGTRSAGKNDCAKIKELLAEFSPDVLLFYAASTHDPASQSADADPQRLLNFIANQAQSECPDELPILLAKKATDLLPYWAASSPSGARETIQLAHAGDVKATRAMADYYAYGTNGFPENEKLRLAWLQRPALEGDVWSMLRLAAYLFTHSQLAEAWAWADFVKDAEAADANARSLAQSMASAIESTASEQVLEKGLDYQDALMAEILKRLQGREAQ